MHKVLMCLAACIACMQALGTEQIPERVVIGSDTLSMYPAPLEHAAYAKIEKRIKEACGSGMHTALWRGYQGLWELRNDTLRLLAVFDTDAVIRGDYRQPISPVGVFTPGEPAFWFSGEVYVGSGKRLSLESGVGYYKTETRYTLRNGVVTHRKVYHNQITGSHDEFSKNTKHIAETFEFPDTPDASRYTRILASFVMDNAPSEPLERFRSIRIIFTKSDGSKEETSDPDHPYAKELLRRLQEIPGYSIYIHDKIFPIGWTIPLKRTNEVKKRR